MLARRKKINHLYCRAGFGISLEALGHKSNLSLESIVDELILGAKNSAELPSKLPNYKVALFEKLSKSEKAVLNKKLRKENSEVNSKWVQNMVDSKNPLLDRMTLFWHGHFPIISKKNPFVSKTYIDTLQKYSLGNFKELVLAIARNPGMIRFLNNQQNKKGKPNENFARELLELFTIGIGHYSEQDVKEAARAFTGWRANKKNEFIFSKNRHDFGKKTFFGQTGNFDGEDIIDLILEKKETARFITTKTYKYFVNKNIDQNIIEQLADTFYNSNYNIEKLMRAIFTSKWFYNEKNIGTKIKSPIDLLVGMMKTLRLDLQDPKSILLVQKMLGQTLLIPPNVAGWPGGQAWIDNASLLFRLNLAGYFFKNTEINQFNNQEFGGQSKRKIFQKLSANMDLTPITNYFVEFDESMIYENLKGWLIQSDLDLKKADIDAFTLKNTKENYIKSMVLRLMTLPEFQLC